MLTLTVWCALAAPLHIPAGWTVLSVHKNVLKLERHVRDEDTALFPMVDCVDRKVRGRSGLMKRAERG